MCEPPKPTIPPKPARLLIAPCTPSEAKFAAQNFHYSGTAPTADAKFYGVWENEEFVGAVIFGSGTARLMPAKFGLEPRETCELTRVALTNHKTPVSRIVSIAIRLLRRSRPQLQLLYSYADPLQGHHGGIYQALGFVYAGTSSPQRELIVAGQPMHKRTAYSKFGTAAPARIEAMTGQTAIYGQKQWKHIYHLPFTPFIASQVEKLRKPYPKRTP